MTRKEKREELEWNAASRMVNHTADLEIQLSNAYILARHRKDLDSIEIYHTLLLAMYRKIRGYADAEDLKEIQELLDNVKEEMQNPREVLRRNVSKVLENLEQADHLISKVRISEGLDIPKRRLPNPEETFVDGLT